MHLIKFIESHRVIEYGGVALDGKLSEHPCECCGSRERYERYRFDIDSLRYRLLCPDCAGAIGRILHPENYDACHSYHVYGVREAPPAVHGDGADLNLLICADDDPALIMWGTYGITYDGGIEYYIARFKTKADAESWASYVGCHEHNRLMDSLQPFIEDGRISLPSQQGHSIVFDINIDDPRKCATLVVHPPCVPLDYNPGPPFYVKTNLYRDKAWHEPAGQDIEDITSESALIDWLEEYTAPTTKK